MLERWPWANVEPGEGEHERYSMAVSAKRTADALERIADFLAEAKAEHDRITGKKEAA